MKQEYPFHSAQFFTASIYNRQPVLADNRYKDIIIESLQFLVNEKRIELNALVIMNNHIHLIWQAIAGFTLSEVQASFMKYTAQQIKRLLIKDHSDILEAFKVNKYDRDYQIWKREPLSVNLLPNQYSFRNLNIYLPDLSFPSVPARAGRRA